MIRGYVKSALSQVVDQVDGQYMFGTRKLLTLLGIAYFSRGHVLIEGPPGTGKTRCARLLAKIFAKSFKRIQFTSDLLPSDILGANVYSQKTGDFKFIEGPIFSDFVLADEINRASPRTQSALLEAMEERQVTIEGTRYELAENFFVVATQNPQDFEGTFPLPEAQMDRFMMQIQIGHNDINTEVDILQGHLAGQLKQPAAQVSPVEIDINRVEEEISQVRCDARLLQYLSRILQGTRTHKMLSQGCSVRGGIAVLNAVRILALANDRDYVIPDDLKEIATPCLMHRIRLNPEAEIADVKHSKVIDEILKSTGHPQ